MLVLLLQHPRILKNIRMKGSRFTFHKKYRHKPWSMAGKSLLQNMVPTFYGLWDAVLGVVSEVPRRGSWNSPTEV